MISYVYKGEKEMIQKLRSKKGFTLMEMLIVVAIIAILVAIAIPAFNTSLNKARIATDEANIRAAYAEVMVKYLDEVDGGASYYKVVTTISKNGSAVNVGGINVEAWNKGDTLYVVVSDEGVVSVTATKPTTGTELTK